ARGPRSRSTSAVGARLPVSPNRLTRTRNVIASSSASKTMTRERLNCCNSRRALESAARTPSATRDLGERLEHLDHVGSSHAHALHVVTADNEGHELVRRVPVLDVHRQPDTRHIDAAD